MQQSASSVHGSSIKSGRTLEARRCARRAVDLACDLIIDRWDQPVQSHCVDLSPYGMLLETTFPVDDGEQVMLSFRPPASSKEVILFARVRHVRRDPAAIDVDGVGLEFENTTVWEQQKLAAALKGLPPPLPGQRRRDSWC